MRKRSRIPISLVDKYYKEIYFLVDTDYTYAQEVIPRVSWIIPLPYEVNIDETTTSITALLAKEIDKTATHFGTYEEAKAKITMGLKSTIVERKRKKIVKNIEEMLKGEEVDAPLELTQGLGEDKSSESEESGEEENVVVKKGKKASIAKPIKKPIQKPNPNSSPVLRSITRAASTIVAFEPQKKTPTSWKRKLVQAKAVPSQIRKKPRRKLILEKEETDSDEEVKKKVPSQNKILTVDDIYHNIKAQVA